MTLNEYVRRLSNVGHVVYLRELGKNWSQLNLGNVPELFDGASSLA